MEPALAPCSMASVRSESIRTGLPLISTITSPRAPVVASKPLIPDRSAGDPGATWITTTPSTPSLVATVSLAAMMPIPGVGTRPLRISSGTIRLTTSTGIANLMPALDPDGERIAVLTPIRRAANDERHDNRDREDESDDPQRKR